MNKKLNTGLFLLAATVLNLIIMGLLVLVLGGLAFFLLQKTGGEGSTLPMILFLVVFIGSIAGTFFIYNRIIKWVVAKWKLEQYIEPIFKPRQPRP